MQRDEIMKRQTDRIFFADEDTDVFFNWLLGLSTIAGLSHGELFHLAHRIGTHAKPAVWQSVFREHGDKLATELSDGHAIRSQYTTADLSLAASSSYRAALQFTHPESDEYSSLVSRMETTFMTGATALGAPIEAIEIPYGQSSLPGYYLHSGQSRPTLFIVGGGDTYREDLFYYAGYPGWRRGYNVLMADLPGQGKTPGRGLTFTVQANEAISACIDWLEGRDKTLGKVALYGLSGGGYFTAQAVERDARIDAWIASTPIYDIAELFRRELGAAAKAPGWLMNTVAKLAGHVNESARLGLEKYAWQFGTPDFKAAVDEVLERGIAVDYTKIRCPALFMVGSSESNELQRQAEFLCDELARRAIDVSFKRFDADSGADAHCQLNNVRLAHNTVFDWLDRTI